MQATYDEATMSNIINSSPSPCYLPTKERRAFIEKHLSLYSRVLISLMAASGKRASAADKRISKGKSNIQKAVYEQLLLWYKEGVISMANEAQPQYTLLGMYRTQTVDPQVQAKRKVSRENIVQVLQLFEFIIKEALLTPRLIAEEEASDNPFRAAQERKKAARAASTRRSWAFIWGSPFYPEAVSHIARY